MKIKYNAPTTLTYAFFCTIVVFTDQFLFHGLTRAFFTVPNALAFDLMKPVNYLRLFTHIAGHADWNHLVTNLAYILLLGPMLEEAYGSLTMFLMMIVTGFVTGVLNACFFPHPLLGASGIVFMMILLASFTNHGRDDIPLTFILIVILYLGREILNAFRGDDISQFAHLAGGLCGSLFGFFSPAKSGAARRAVRTAVNPARITATRPNSTPAKRPANAEKASTSKPSAGGKRTPTGKPAAGPKPASGQKTTTSTKPATPRKSTTDSSNVRIKRKPSAD